MENISTSPVINSGYASQKLDSARPDTNLNADSTQTTVNIPAQEAEKGPSDEIMLGSTKQDETIMMGKQLKKMQSSVADVGGLDEKAKSERSDHIVSTVIMGIAAGTVAVLAGAGAVVSLGAVCVGVGYNAVANVWYDNKYGHDYPSHDNSPHDLL